MRKRMIKKMKMRNFIQKGTRCEIFVSSSLLSSNFNLKLVKKHPFIYKAYKNRIESNSTILAMSHIYNKRNVKKIKK